MPVCIICISEDSFVVGGRIVDISIKREEVVYEVEHFPLWGSGPPFPSPVYVRHLEIQVGVLELFCSKPLA